MYIFPSWMIKIVISFVFAGFHYTYPFGYSDGICSWWRAVWAHLQSWEIQWRWGQLWLPSNFLSVLFLMDSGNVIPLYVYAFRLVFSSSSLSPVSVIATIWYVPVNTVLHPEKIIKRKHTKILPIFRIFTRTTLSLKNYQNTSI